MEETKEAVSVAKETMDVKQESKKTAIVAVIANAVFGLVLLFLFFIPMVNVVSGTNVESKSLFGLLVNSGKAKNYSGYNVEQAKLLLGYEMLTYVALFFCLLNCQGSTISALGASIYLLGQPNITTEEYSFRRGSLVSKSCIIEGMFIILALVMITRNEIMTLGIGFYVFLIAFIVWMIMSIVVTALANSLDKKIGFVKPKKR